MKSAIFLILCLLVLVACKEGYVAPPNEDSSAGSYGTYMRVTPSTGVSFGVDMGNGFYLDTQTGQLNYGIGF